MCRKHKIDKTLKTPMRNHIQFPPSLVTDKKRRLEELVKKKKAAVPRRFLDTEESLSEIVKVPKRSLCDVKQSVSIVERAKPFPEKSKTPDASLKPVRDRLHKDKERTRFFREFENVKCHQKTSVLDKCCSSGWEETAKSNFSRKKQTTVDDASKKRLAAFRHALVLTLIILVLSCKHTHKVVIVSQKEQKRVSFWIFTPYQINALVDEESA